MAVLAGLMLLANPAGAAEPGLLDRWFDAQAGLRSWQAEFVQTRTLKALTTPLTTPGRAVFRAPDQFRWELGEPAQTVAIRGPHELVVLYPRLARAERYPLDPAQAGRFKDLLLLLEAGFPRSRSELEQNFRVRQQTAGPAEHAVVLEPRSPAARRLMPELQLAFHPTALTLLWTEMRFTDGSTLRTEFRSPTPNPPLAEGLFATDIPSGYQLAEPLKKR